MPYPTYLEGIQEFMTLEGIPECFEILGIDPAPSKPAMIWGRKGPESACSPGELRHRIENRLESGQALLVAWDSPLSFDPANGFSDRPIDKIVRRWVSREIRKKRIEEGAVSVRPFSGCPHWVISCHALGLPFGTRPRGLELSPASFQRPASGQCFVVETHPAVALAVLWMEAGHPDPFPRYKGPGTRDVSRTVAERLGFPEEAGADDDVLDAFVGWLLACRFVEGRAVLMGSPREGGYLLPAAAASIVGAP